jgi:hypothetical protein
MILVGSGLMMAVWSHQLVEADLMVIPPRLVRWDPTQPESSDNGRLTR